MAYTTIPPNATGDAAGIGLLVTSIFTLLLAGVSLLLRIWVRRLKKRALALNDWLLFIGWVFSFFLTINIIIYVGWAGLGQQQSKVSADSVLLTFQLLPPAESLWATANTATKVSILLVYKDIFVVKWFRMLADGVIAMVIMLGVGNVIQALAICRPFAYQWDKTIEGGVCGQQTLGILLVAFINLITDLIIVIMPMPLVWNLKMPRSKRLALVGIFAFGFAICFSTVVRIVFTFSLTAHPENSTYWIGINAIFLTLEPNLGIVNACLLLLKPLMDRLGPKLGWVSDKQSSDDYPLSASPRNRVSKFMPNRYPRHDLDSTFTSTFTRLDDNNEVAAAASMDSLSHGTSAHQEREVSGGQQYARSVEDLEKGIKVTRTLDMKSYRSGSSATFEIL